MVTMHLYPRPMKRRALRLEMLTLNNSSRLAKMRRELEAQDMRSQANYDQIVREMKSILVREAKKKTT